MNDHSTVILYTITGQTYNWDIPHPWGGDFNEVILRRHKSGQRYLTFGIAGEHDLPFEQEDLDEDADTPYAV